MTLKRGSPSGVSAYALTRFRHMPLRDNLRPSHHHRGGLSLGTGVYRALEPLCSVLPLPVA